MTFKIFRKRPVSIWAAQWDGTAEGATPIINFILANGGTARYRSTLSPSMASIRIDTLEGIMAATPGDWIIRGVQGEFYPCKPDIFAKTYDDHVGPRFLTIGLYRFPPVDPITGEVSAADDAISMGDMAHEDVPPPHRNPNCDFVMNMHKWIDDGSEYGIVICP